MNNNIFKYWIIFIYIIFFSKILISQSSIDQKLSIHINSGVNGGAFSINYKIKGTELPEAKTLGSLNADIVYDSSLIRFLYASDWNQNILDNGYDKYINDNFEINENRAIRIMIAGLNINSDSSGTQTGFNFGSEYATILRLNFIILDNSKSISLSIKSSTNQIGLFTNPGNNPNTFEIYDNLLSPPVLIENEPLPVVFSDFNASVSADNVSLKWITSFEINNKGFSIERKQENSNWSEMGFVNGKGNSNSQTQYSFDDKKLTSGKYYYRIKQIDKNGNYKYFSLKNTIEIAIPKKFNLSQNYPNPFNPVTKINYELPQDSKVNLTIFDILGREISKLVNQEQKAGYYTVTANSKNLASGTYFYRLIAYSNGKDYVATKKMSVIK